MLPGATVCGSAFIIGVPVILTPFPYITTQVINAQLIGFFAANGVRFSSRISLIPSYFANIVATCIGVAHTLTAPAGRAAGKPGVPCAAVDKATRDVIEAAGYGKYFTHRTGHGIGMEGHEEPYMRGDNMQLLEPGMAYTVEPGIYLTNRNGVRIEDNVVVTETGADCLSDMPREIQVVG